MSLFGLFGLKVLNFILGLLPDLDFSSIPQLESVSYVTNIFAWVNYFLPTPTIVALLSVLAGYYAFRLLFNVIIQTKDILK